MNGLQRIHDTELSFGEFLVGTDLAIENNDTVVIGVGKRDGNTLFYPVNQLSKEEFKRLIEKISTYYNNSI